MSKLIIPFLCILFAASPIHARRPTQTCCIVGISALSVVLLGAGIAMTLVGFGTRTRELRCDKNAVRLYCNTTTQPNVSTQYLCHTSDNINSTLSVFCIDKAPSTPPSLTTILIGCGIPATLLFLAVTVVSAAS